MKNTITYWPTTTDCDLTSLSARISYTVPSKNIMVLQILKLMRKLKMLCTGNTQNDTVTFQSELCMGNHSTRKIS